MPNNKSGASLKCFPLPRQECFVQILSDLFSDLGGFMVSLKTPIQIINLLVNSSVPERYRTEIASADIATALKGPMHNKICAQGT